MIAYDENGEVLGRTGEEHGLPAEPKEFWVQGNGIKRIERETVLGEHEFGERGIAEPQDRSTLLPGFRL